MPHRARTPDEQTSRVCDHIPHATALRTALLLTHLSLALDRTTGLEAAIAQAMSEALGLGLP